MPPLIVSLPGAPEMAEQMASALSGAIAEMHIRQFPDGEWYVRFLSEPAGRAIVVLANLSWPDDKLAPLLFAADAARELGAKSVGLVSPYLSYMRQDIRFLPGEAVTSRSFARILSGTFDWLVTVDPHLHRWSDLGEIYDIPTTAVQASGELAKWISQNVRDPLVIGPDAESRQWSERVARQLGAPYIVCEKMRHGDRDIELKLPDLSGFAGKSPVIVDDTISTGSTMIALIKLLKGRVSVPPVCCAVHGLFVGQAERALHTAGALQIITCNCVPHPTNKVDVSRPVAMAVKSMLDQSIQR
jgi:ribose-phosphate pyrophosphokinase